MAATTRATTPSYPTEPFTSLEGAPRTPASLSSTAGLASTTAELENVNLLRAQPQQQPDLTRTSLSPKSLDKTRLSPVRPAALHLTGAAAMAEMKRRKQQQQAQQQVEQNSRQTSPNPAAQALHSLMGAGGMSRAADAPAPAKLSEPLRTVAEHIQLPDNNTQVGTDDQVSPVSLGSFGTLDSSSGGAAGAGNNAMTATANDRNAASGQQFVAEPDEMNDNNNNNYQDNNGNLAVPDQQGDKAISFSYPGPPPQQDENQQGGPSRGMSLPGYGQGSPKSPAASNKRHKCPYCSTDFTRHHNLKSHLLTHSQEKPYVCQTCQARFRRLHDLKRHTKLHTGERPHTCDRCGRRFARGDALARHNKGPGGCAGRRSSFGGEDDFGDDGGMEGIEYDDDEETDEHGRRVSESNRKRQHLETPQDPDRQIYRQHSRTYPPAPTQSMRGNMGPPQVVHPPSSNATSPREMPGQPSPAGGSSIGSYYGSGQVFAEPGVMTQSPKPLSPGQPPDAQRLSVGEQGGARNRSTSLTTQFQQAHFGRQPGSGGGRTPPMPNAQFPPGQAPPQNILPPLGAGNQQRQPSSMSGAPSMHAHQPMPTGVINSNPGSHSSHGRSSGSSMRDIMQNPDDLWAYVRQLESRFSRMQDEYELRISRMQDELISLKGQVSQISNAGSYTSNMGSNLDRMDRPYP
ncbi:hypothetical protein DOTSEDRAFT_75143 [Dothistroma septosporum NZE10]|uniref:C2H2-type domain-containing protein n=1 Tax=Dothistroma septosporum (strain NZE10 / CBS 128990) TaxID=675120 RepID=M2YK46_DOTSN|nr:hypothetical protein DOTSEDRAFT_75143 [Dothistroma septosporum NZE10]